MNVQQPTLSTGTLIAAVNDPDFDEFDMSIGNITDTKHSTIPEFMHLHQENNCKENREQNIPSDQDADFECPPVAQKKQNLSGTIYVQCQPPPTPVVSSANNDWPMHTSSGKHDSW